MAEQKKLLGAQKVAFNLRPRQRSSGIRIEDISSQQQARGSSHVQVSQSSKDKGKAKMYEGAANNNGLFSEHALNIMEQKGLSSKDLDKIKVSNVGGKFVGESVADILNKSLEKLPLNEEGETGKLADEKDGFDLDVEAYLQESVLNLMNKPTQEFELMDVEEVIAMYEEFKLIQKRDNP
ncbi:hypothetical protein AgCh_015894 [Apium graveolens]